MTTQQNKRLLPNGLGRLSAADLDLIARAEAVRGRASTRSDLEAELERGLALARKGDPSGPRVLTEAVEAIANFKHIVHADGDFFLSLYVRGMLDSAYWTLESSATPPEVAERIRQAQRLIDRGDETGVRALEAALKQG